MCLGDQEFFGDPSVNKIPGQDFLVVAVSQGIEIRINPGFGNQPALIAYEMNGEPFAANGFARLVLPNDVRAGRSVSRLIGLEVLTAAP